MRFILLLLCAALLSGCVRHLGAPTEPAPALPDYALGGVEHRIYTPPDWPQELQADVYLPRAQGPRPAVLVVHGGGWERRSPQDMEGIARALAEHGFVAVNIGYRFAPEYTFPAQLQDLQMAMRWLHVHAAEFGIDRGRVGAWGYSSGAHLVALLATVASDGGSPLNQPYGGPVTLPRAVVAGGTPTDLRKFQGGKLVPQFLGGSQAERPDVYASASPITHVTAATPPFFLYHGTLDHVVPVDHAEDFRAALQANGVRNELFLLRGRGHIATFLLGGSAERAAMEFLARELALPEAGTR
ncbi:alpha/beta hydrolase [Alloalcanivorax mobilis]|uniref:alpha/beta hydrolase n=1 Tax=Alloalcanivorax mobilis TaxID=2019569 RepID=UPI000C75DBE3|nr:alpha/beta hydrolase [Alloalcanivorax mobilis]